MSLVDILSVASSLATVGTAAAGVLVYQKAIKETKTTEEKRPLIINSALVVLVVVLVFVSAFLLSQTLSNHGLNPVASLSGTATPNSTNANTNPNSNTLAPIQPTATFAPVVTPTPTEPTTFPSGTLQENIPLCYTCNSAFAITIISIVVDQNAKNMTWNIIFNNHSGDTCNNGYGPGFDSLELFIDSNHKYDASGTAMYSSQSSAISPGKSNQVSAIVPYIPQPGQKYTIQGTFHENCDHYPYTQDFTDPNVSFG